ncbi:hypothetical protein HYV70_05445 [Candidatus Uhrbacteria bacterium]|nr:hypothetical protein [Candidatus Uhrbacteria bacterium]
MNPNAIVHEFQKTQMKGLTLVDFLRLAHELFGVEFPEKEILDAVTESSNDFNTRVQEILVKNGWQKQEFTGFRLTNTSGMVFAYIRDQRYPFDSEENWYGGFVYTVAYPEDTQQCDKAIEQRMPLATQEDVQKYRRYMPGLGVADINVNNLKVMAWWRARANKRSQDFKDWVRIFERLFDQLDFSESYGPGEQMFVAIYDEYWQWTELDHKEVESKLVEIANSAKDEAEVRVRILTELNYPFDNIYMFEQTSFFGSKKSFFVEITSPMGRTCRLTSNKDSW